MPNAKNHIRHWLRILVATPVLVFALLPSGALASERIALFESYIQIHSDNRLTVTETITVQAAGNKIQRGIYRDFPTRYKGRHGQTRNVAFQVLEVLRNGVPEAYHFDRRSNGMRLYIGHKDRHIPPGRHIYTIHYRTDRQIGFFKEFDELYWNVTGNAWAFPIQEARAVVELPFGAAVIESTAYTGPQGARGRNFTVDSDEIGNILFSTQRPLKPGEGLTIMVAWPKGYIAEPAWLDTMRYLVRDNPGTIVAFWGIVILAGYLLIAWFKVGRDPAKGPIIPLFKPPPGFTPAAVRYVNRMAFDHKAFAAAIVNMAVKGFLTIDENDDEYTLSRTAIDQAGLSPGEKRIARKLFGQGHQITLEQRRHRQIKQALKALKTSLQLDFEKIHFQRNAKWLLPGLIISLATLIAVIFSARDMAGALFMIVWLSGWTVACFALVVGALRAWRRVLAAGSQKSLFKGNGALKMTLIALPFLGGELFGLWAFTGMTSPLAAAAMLIIVFINVLFYHLIKAPTLYGRRVMDQVQGFKLYLSVAEKEGLNLRNPPEKTPALFEKFLPYALALDVENEWTEQFADVLARSQIESGYSPGWYSGRSMYGRGINGLATRLGTSLASSIASSSSAPGSSSGSGGGGSSGGGGGGGGGGGW